MVKILSKSGDSLADIYDVAGSVAGIEELVTQELPIVHEMGATIFSERLRRTIRFEDTGDLLQSVGADIFTDNMPAGLTRLLAIVVVSDNASRISVASVLAREPLSSGGIEEIPLWIWDQSNSVRSKISHLGTASTVDVLVPSLGSVQLPSFSGGSGSESPRSVTELALRCSTTAFGAGTVFVRAFYYIAFPFFPGLSPRGLLVPSW